MKTKIGWIILAAALSGVAFAGSEAMQGLDADESGTISKEEASADDMLIEVFEEIDINEDGEIDTVEFAQFEEGTEAGEDATDK